MEHMAQRAVKVRRAVARLNLMRRYLHPVQKQLGGVLRAVRVSRRAIT
jgi:hypothetical protein